MHSLYGNSDSLRHQSRLRDVEQSKLSDVESEGIKSFTKKRSQKFWYIKNLHYLCKVFPSMRKSKRAEGCTEKHWGNPREHWKSYNRQRQESTRAKEIASESSETTTWSQFLKKSRLCKGVRYPGENALRSLPFKKKK